MAKVRIEKKGVFGSVDESKLAGLQAKGWTLAPPKEEAPAPAPAPAAEEPGYFSVDAMKKRGAEMFTEMGKANSAAQKGAETTVAMGMDDDIAGRFAGAGDAAQKDFDAGEKFRGLRRMLGAALPLLSESGGLYPEYDPSVVAEGANEQRAKVNKAFEEKPAAAFLGAGLGAGLTAGSSAAGAGAGFLRRGLAAAPVGALTGYQSKDQSQNDDGTMRPATTRERLVNAAVGGGVAAGGAAVLPPLVNAAASAGKSLGNAGAAVLRSIEPAHPMPLWSKVDRAIAAVDDPGLIGTAVKAGANAKLSGAPSLAIKGAKILRRKVGPAPRPKVDVSAAKGYIAEPSADDLLVKQMTGGADLVDDLAASADDIAEEAPLVLRKRIIPVGPEDIVDDVAPRAAPVPDNTPTPRPMTPAEMEAAISRLPSRGKPPKPSPLDEELEAVGAGLREGTPVPLEGADVDPFVAPRDPTAVGRKTPRPAPMPEPEVMPDDFVDEGVSVLRQLPGRRAAPQLEAAPETLQLEGRGDVPALPARPAQRQLEAPAPVLRKRTPDKPRKLFGPPDTFQGAAEASPDELAASWAKMQSERVMPDVEPARMPLLPPDLLEAQLARTGGNREKALAAAHGQLSREFKRTDPELARGRQRSAVGFDDASPGPAPIATPKGRNRSAAPFQGEDWAPREKAPAAVVDDVAAPVASEFFVINPTTGKAVGSAGAVGPRWKWEESLAGAPLFEDEASALAALAKVPASERGAWKVATRSEMMDLFDRQQASAPAPAPVDRVDFWRKKGDELRERPYPPGKFDEAAERANQRPPAAPFQDPDPTMSAAVDAADVAARAAEKAKTPEAYRAAAQANSDAAQEAWNRGDKVAQRAFDETATGFRYDAKLAAERIAAEEGAARVAAKEAAEAARIANRTPAQVARVRASEAADALGAPEGNTPENARRAAQVHMEAAEIADSEQSRRFLMQNAAELERHAAALTAKASAPPKVLRKRR
jgi:hypothetical protein